MFLLWLKLLSTYFRLKSTGAIGLLPCFSYFYCADLKYSFSYSYSHDHQWGNLTTMSTAITRFTNTLRYNQNKAPYNHVHILWDILYVTHSRKVELILNLEAIMFDYLLTIITSFLIYNSPEKYNHTVTLKNSLIAVIPVWISQSAILLHQPCLSPVITVIVINTIHCFGE